MDNWKILHTFTYPQDAHLVKSYLESEGIDVVLQDELTTQVNNFISNAIGGVKLWVRDEDIAKGIEILEKGGYITVGDTEPPIEWVANRKDKTHCPFCHSDNMAKNSQPNLLSVVLYFIMGVLFPLFRTSYKCYDCDKQWRFK